VFATLSLPVRLGPLSIPPWLILVLIALAVMSIAAKLLYRREPEIGRRAVDAVQGGLLVGFGAWKLSVLITKPMRILESPLNLLYLPGGTFGVILGLIGAGVYIAFRITRYQRQTPEVEIDSAVDEDALDKAPGNHARPTIGLLRAILVVAAVGIGVFILGAAAWPRGGSGSDGSMIASRLPTVGSPAVPFTLETMEGKTVSLTSYEGRSVVVNFWATWCPPCRAEVSEFIDFHAEYGGDEDGPVILAVNMTTGEKWERDVTDFIEEYGITFTVLMDRTGRVSENYGVQAIPTTIIVSPDGSIGAVKVGAADAAWLRRNTVADR
jgi:peroxiredoxin